MEKIRKQTVDRIAEFFNGESNNPKVDTYKKLLDFENEIKQQFSLQGVVASLLCVDSKDYSYITPKAKYKVIEKLQGCYKIVNDYGIEGVYEKDCFKEL